MKRHLFNQSEITMLEPRRDIQSKDLKWKEFTETVAELGGWINARSGSFLTHEVVGLDEDDFDFVLQMLA